MKGHKPHWVPGSPWYTCDRCGFDYRRSDIKKTWDGLMVCKWDWEPRHPQDYKRTKIDKIAVKDARPQPTDIWVEDVYPNGISQSDL